jgi:hypothetical protein
MESSKRYAALPVCLFMVVAHACSAPREALSTSATVEPPRMGADAAAPSGTGGAIASGPAATDGGSTGANPSPDTGTSPPTPDAAGPMFHSTRRRWGVA